MLTLSIMVVLKWDYRLWHMTAGWEWHFKWVSFGPIDISLTW